jgi:hypothetical protein
MDGEGHAMRIVLAALLALAAVQARAQPLPYQEHAMNLGVVNCANSLCHGSISRWKDSDILQNEYITWSRVDKHATRAYQALLTERSKRIARNLGLREPPEKAKLCLDCHAYDPPPELRGERFKVTDGVSCEACHGPAEHWIKSHVAPGATHEDNLAHGLYPTSNPVAQARLCLSCHFGNKDKFVTHRMMGAGHPRMSFELATFEQTEPPHFVIDDDWHRRKGSWDTARVWAIGQALAASQLLDVLLDPKRSHDGLFPELVVFDCHAGHHPMSDKRWTPLSGVSPGRVRLNDSSLLMLRQIVRRMLPEADARSYDERLVALRRAVAGDGGDPLDAARAMRTLLDRVAGQLVTRSFLPADLRAMLAGMVQDGLDGDYHDYAGAEQATMAIAGLLDYLGRHGGLADFRGANDALDRVYDAVRDDEKFSPARFQAALDGLRKTVIR